MSIVSYGKYIHALRARKKMTQNDYSEELGIHVVTQSRLEAGKYLPESNKSLSYTLAYTHLEEQDMEVLAMRHRIITLLDRGEVDAAASILNEMEKMPGFQLPLNRQFLCSQKARLLEQMNAPISEIKVLIDEGLQKTFINANVPIHDNEALLFEEPELFHTLARTHARAGNLHEAIRILKSLDKNLARYNASDKDRERQAVPILHSLAKFQLQASLYADAIITCENGFHYAATRRQGLRAPDFLFIQAQAQYALYINDCTSSLRHAYFCYTLLHKNKDANILQGWAKNVANISINTYDVEQVMPSVSTYMAYAKGELAGYKTIGQMLGGLRKKAGYSQKELSQGICSSPTLHRIENGEIKNDIRYLEPLMQRLGRDAHLFAPYYLKQEDFIDLQMKENIHMLCAIGDYENAEMLLAQLKLRKKWQSQTNLQFIKAMEIAIHLEKDTNVLREIPNLILNALTITCPKFNEKNIAYYPLTHDEKTLINMLAGYYVNIGEYTRASKIYEQLLDNVRETYEDETEKSKIYATILYNYSRCLGKMGRRREALEIVQEGINFDRDRERICLLPLLVFNKAYNLYELGNKDESFPYFAQAFYGVSSFESYGLGEHKKIAQRVIYERFNVIFD